MNEELYHNLNLCLDCLVASLEERSTDLNMDEAEMAVKMYTNIIYTKQELKKYYEKEPK